MVSVKELGAKRVIVKVVEVVPMRRFCASVGELRLKTGFPTPVKVTLDVPLVTLSVRVRLPVRVPVAVGVKVTLKEHFAPTASVKGVKGQLLVSAKSPVVAMAVIVRGTLLVPLFNTVTTCTVLLVVFIVVAGNTRLGGVNSTVVTALMPVPVRVTKCGLPVALSLMASCSVSNTSTVGVNVTLIVQRPPPAGTVPTQSSVSAKSPLVVMLDT